MTLHSAEAEALVLGALLDGESMTGVPVGDLLSECCLGPQDFADVFNATAFSALRALAERGRPTDASSVCSLLATRMDAATALPRLLGLQSQNVITRPVLGFRAAELKRLTKLRELEAFHRNALERLSHHSAEPAQLAMELDAFAQAFTGTEEDFYTGEKDIEAIHEEWDAATRGVRATYLPTGITALDGVVDGWPENLSIVAGASSGGKTALVATSILNAMVAGHRVAVFGLEDGTKAMQRRFLALRTGMRLKAIGRERLTEAQRLALDDEMPKLWNLSRERLLSYQPKDGERIPSSRLIQLAKRAVVHHRVRAVFIDHGLEIEHEAKHRGEEMRHRVGRTFAALRTLAFSHNVPVVVVLHLNRSGAKSDGPPRQEDLAEAADCERVARLILGVWNAEGDDAHEARVTVMKQTEGAKRVHLSLRRELEQGLINSVHGEEFTWPPPKPQRPSGERMPF